MQGKPSPAAPRAGLAHFNHRTWCYGWGPCSSRRLHGPAPCRGVSHTIIEELVDSPRSPFHPLGLAAHQKAGGYERAARRQVAQLRRLKADPGALALECAPDWPSLFDDPTRPLVVDLGCGAGRCMLMGAAAAAHTAPQAAAQAAAQAVAQMQPARAGHEAGGGQGAAARASVDSESSGGRGGGGAEARVCPERAPAALAAKGDDVSGLDGGGVSGCTGGGGSVSSSAGGGGGGGCNFLGVDVRLALTSRANAWSALLGCSGRAAFLCANANACLPLLLGSYGRSSSGSSSSGSSNGSGSSSSSSGSSSSGSGSSGSGSALAGSGHQERAQGRRQGLAAGGRQGLAAGGRVALVCLQFSDPVADRGPQAGPNWRREALVGGSELVEQLAEALEPGALVWIQSDVLSTAATFRCLFWRHGGFAPSARHAAASSATRTREWLRPDATGGASGSPSGPATGTGAAVLLGEGCSADNAAGAGAGFSGMAPGRQPAASLLPSRPQSQPPWQLQPHSELKPHPEVQPHSGLQPSQRLPLLLTGTDLATHVEPWLTGEQVAEVSACHRLARLRAPSGSSSSSSTTTAAKADAGPEAVLHGDGEAGEDGWRDLPWLDSNPLGVPTERELYVERGCRDIYRLLLVRR